MDYTLGISICEDIWNDEEFWQRPLYEKDPIEDLISQGANIIINISSSPFAVGKHDKIRLRMLIHDAVKYKVPFVYVNQVGGNDDLVFDGNSSVINAEGSLIARSAAFEEDLIVVDIEKSVVQLQSKVYSPVESIHKALIVGLGDYAIKCGFKKSGHWFKRGIDSAVTAALAAESLGKDNVIGVLMPSQFSSQGSIDDAVRLAQNLGIIYKKIPIKDILKHTRTP